jgi:hypothetical protein
MKALRIILGIHLLVATALAQKVEIGNLAYEKNPPYPEAQNPQLPLEVYDDEFAEILGKQPQLTISRTASASPKGRFICR